VVCLLGHCCGDITTNLREDASLHNERSTPCLDSKRRMITAMVTTVPGTWVPTVHAPCHHNEVVSLMKRSLAPTTCSAIEARGPVLTAFKKLFRVVRRYGDSRWGLLETAQSYKGLMGRRYLEAHRSLMEDGPVCSRDVKLKAFVKAEKVEPWRVAKPRMIFPRSPRYNLALASWLKPLEHWLWGNLKSKALSGNGNSRVVAKGLNHVQRANLIVRKMRDIGEAVVFEVDGKAFEAHVDTWQLVQEHKVYKTAYPKDVDLVRLLGKQLHMDGRTSSGVKFGRDGGRASGDVNTGMGNSLIMLAVVMGTMSHFNVPWDTLVDGDNALLFLRREDAVRVHAEFYEVCYNISGHEMVLERPVDIVEQVRFGRSAPVKTTKGWKMVRDYLRVLSHSASSHQHLREPKQARKFLLAVSLCESVLGDGVPILWAYANNLRARTGDDVAPDLRVVGDYEYLGVDLGRLGRWASQPDGAARHSFYLAFGVDVEEQLRIEKLIMATHVRYVVTGHDDDPTLFEHPYDWGVHAV